MSIDSSQMWTVLQPLAERGQTEQMLSSIRSIADDAERIGLYRSTIRHLAFDDWNNKNLDVMTALADAAIADCDRLGGDFLQQANVICYNTAANLADCWADDFPREARHFEKGIEYATKARWYRNHLGKGPGAMAMAMWALGKHEQSLGRFEEATSTFRQCVELEREAALAAGKPATIAAGAPAGFLIAAGYLALMERDRATLDALRAVLEAGIALGGEAKADAEIILGQLRVTGAQLSVKF
jgi:hypothetical protein